MRVIAVVGMPGAGKSEVTRVLAESGYISVRFGDITDEEVSRRDLPLNEENERQVREELRKIHGMAAYALLSLPKIEKALQTSAVVIDGLYSWEEYKLLKMKYGDNFKVVAVWASPATRYKRLGSRKIRPLTPEEAVARDQAEIENINKGGPIAMADFTICNEFTLKDLYERTRGILVQLK